MKGIYTVLVSIHCNTVEFQRQPPTNAGKRKSYRLLPGTNEPSFQPASLFSLIPPIFAIYHTYIPTKDNISLLCPYTVPNVPQPYDIHRIDIYVPIKLYYLPTRHICTIHYSAYNGFGWLVHKLYVCKTYNTKIRLHILTLAIYHLETRTEFKHQAPCDRLVWVKQRNTDAATFICNLPTRILSNSFANREICDAESLWENSGASRIRPFL